MDLINWSLSAIDTIFSTRSRRPEWTERIAAKVCSCSSQRQNKSILTTLGRALQWDFSCSLPDYRHYSPPPTKCLRLLFRQAWSSGSATGAETNGTGPDGCLPELDMFPHVAKLCLWYMCFCAEVFFSVLTLYSPMEHSLGVKLIFFSSLSSCKCCIFLPFPVFLFCLPRCQMYVVYV